MDSGGASSRAAATPVEVDRERKAEEELVQDEDLERIFGVAEKADVDMQEVEEEVDRWIQEIQDAGIEEDHEAEGGIAAWDDVHGGELPADLVSAARREEVDFMEERGIWSVKPMTDCLSDTGRPPALLHLFCA